MAQMIFIKSLSHGYFWDTLLLMAQKGLDILHFTHSLYKPEKV